jgi:hypothetical protein
VAESTLNLKKADLESKVGIFLGWGGGANLDDTPWTTMQANRIKDAVDSGYRQFLVPAPDQNGESHDWSFLRPVGSAVLANGEQAVLMSDDYGSLEGTVTVTQTSTDSHWPVQVTGEGRIREMYAKLPSATGRPLWAAERPLRGTGQEKSSRYELVVYPQANEDFTLEFAYYLLPEALTDRNPFCYGGMQHAETILESCLAVAEERINDERGIHSQKFAERLAASIAIDRRNKAQLVGYNGDRSDCRDSGYWPWREKYLTNRITYYGNLPG